MKTFLQSLVLQKNYMCLFASIVLNYAAVIPKSAANKNIQNERTCASDSQLKYIFMMGPLCDK